MLRCRLALLCAVVSLMLVSGCGLAGTPPPDTSPIATTGVVGGTVHMTIVPGAPVQSILVTVGGTTLTANVSRLGDFVLSNVPAGPLELRFTGEGIAAVLPAGQIAGGETVTLAIRLTPAEGVIESMSRLRGTSAIVEGVIEVPGLPLPANTIIVGGRTIMIPPGVASSAALKPGVRVRVTGTASAAGVTAQEVAIL
jgi:hypothetical protein